ncbi:hypothetical protein MTO96_006273 [Rhipicephalus appendiculatus]
MPDQMASSGAGLMDVAYTPGGPSGSPRGVAASSPSWSSDRAEDAAKLSPESEESREKIDLRRDEGNRGRKPVAGDAASRQRRRRYRRRAAHRTAGELDGD